MVAQEPRGEHIVMYCIVHCAQQLKVVHLVASAMLLTLRLPPLERYR